MELWNSTRKIKLGNEKARVQFHYNPKLCKNRILEFVDQAGISRPDDENIDIGVTNGDKVACKSYYHVQYACLFFIPKRNISFNARFLTPGNVTRLETEIIDRTETSVSIKWQNFRRNLIYASHLLDYDVYYREAPDYPHVNVSIFHDRDPCGEDGWNILSFPKMSDEDAIKEYKESGSKKDLDVSKYEPYWEKPKNISSLRPYKWYVYYVNTNVVNEKSYNNTGAQSDLKYFQTLPSHPGKPAGFVLRSGKSDEISVQWETPINPNGKLVKFRIWLKQYKEDQSLQNQRDYCNKGRPVSNTNKGSSSKQVGPPKKTTSAPSFPGSVFGNKDKDGEDCCSCTATRPQNRPSDVEDVLFENDVRDAIFDNVFISNGPSPAETNDIPRRKRRRRRDVMLDHDHDDHGTHGHNNTDERERMDDIFGRIWSKKRFSKIPSLRSSDRLIVILI